jgi:hypothetical protein
VTATDNDAIARVRLVLDGQVVADLFTEPYSVTLQIKARGTHLLETIVTDRSGNVATESGLLVR